MPDMIMKQSFWKRFWSSTRESYGALVAIFSIPLAIVLWLFPPDTHVPLGIVICAGMVVFAMLISFTHMAYSILKELSSQLPRVIHSREGAGTFEHNIVVCLLEESTLFSQGIAVSFYFKDSEKFEVFIGTGVVINVQDDRRIQVGLREMAKGQEDAVTKLKNNDSAALQCLIIKPNVQVNPTYIATDGVLDA